MPIVLVIEDNETIRDSLAEILRMEDFEVMTAKNGESAIRLLKESPKKPSLIFLDILMPEMNGVEFRKRQLEIPEIRDIPTVVLTCGDAKPDLIHEMAPTAWLQKPVNVDEIVLLARQAGAREAS